MGSLSLPLNPNQMEPPMAQHDQDQEDPVPVTLAIRLKPIGDSCGNIQQNISNRCLFTDIGPTFPGCVPNEKNHSNTIYYRPSNANVGIQCSRPEEESLGSGGLNQNNWHFQNGIVFSEDSTQEELFSESLAQFVEVVLDGYDLTILAYGQSGTGKSHTLFGPDNVLGLANSESDFGLLQRFVRSLFHNVDQVGENRKPHVIFTVSSIDVDDNDVRDLLADGHEGKIDLIDRSDGGEGRKVEMFGLTEIECGSIDEVLFSFENGRAIQQSGSSTSSVMSQKAHHIFSINVIQTYQAIGPFVEKIVKHSTVRFVELASSTQKSTQTYEPYVNSPSSLHHSDLPLEFLGSGNNVKHGNLALGNVVSALGDSRRNVTHEVRQELYQYSLITRILQDALGGSSLTLAVCCLSSIKPENEESVNTLNFAKHLSNIACYPLLRSKKVDIDKVDAEIAFLHGNGSVTELNGGCGADEDLLQKDLRSVSANINLGHMPNLMLSSEHNQPSSLPPTHSLAECTLSFTERSPVNSVDNILVAQHNGNIPLPANSVTGCQSTATSDVSMPFIGNLSNQAHMLTNPSFLLQHAARKSYQESLAKCVLELQSLQTQQHQLVTLKQQYLNSMNVATAHPSITAANQYDLSIIESQIKLLDAQITILQNKTQQLQLLYDQSDMSSMDHSLIKAIYSPVKGAGLLSSPAFQKGLTSNVTNPILSPNYSNNNYSHFSYPTSPSYNQYYPTPQGQYPHQSQLINQYGTPNPIPNMGLSAYQSMLSNPLVPTQPPSNAPAQRLDEQRLDLPQRTSPFMPITQRSTPQDVSPLSHKQSPVSVQMYLQSTLPQMHYEQSYQNISPLNLGNLVSDKSPVKSKVTDDVNVPLNLKSNNENIQTNSGDAQKRKCNKKDGPSTNPGANKNLADQLKLASIVEESEHELTPPRLSRMTDTSITITDSGHKKLENCDYKLDNSSQSDISASSCVSTDEEVRVVTGCSSSEDEDTDDEDSHLSENNDNESFDSECSDMSSGSTDSLAGMATENRILFGKEETMPTKIEVLYEQFRSENLFLLEKAESLLKEELSLPGNREMAIKLDGIDCHKKDSMITNNEEKIDKIVENDSEKNMNIGSKGSNTMRDNEATKMVTCDNNWESNSTQLDAYEKELQRDSKEIMVPEQPPNNTANMMNNNLQEGGIQNQIKVLALKRDAEKASAVRISADLKVVDVQLKELKDAIKVKGGLIRDLEKTDREIKVALGQFEKRKQQLLEEQAETRRKLRKAKDYLKEVEQKDSPRKRQTTILMRKKTENSIEDTTTLRKNIAEYRSQIEDMGKKIEQLDVSQHDTLTALEGTSNEEYLGTLDQLNLASTGRIKRVKEEQTLVRRMKEEYTKLQNKLKKELDRKKKLEKNAEGDEIKIRLLERQLSEKDELVLQLSKSLQHSQDLEELKQSLDSKEQTLGKAVLEFKKERLEFEQEKLVQKSKDLATKNHQWVESNLDEESSDRRVPDPSETYETTDKKNETPSAIDEQTLRSEIQGLRKQKDDLYQTLEIYECKKNEYEKNLKLIVGTGASKDDREKIEENKAFLDDYKTLVTEMTITIELIDMTIDYKNEKLCGNAIVYDSNIETDSLALQKLCALDIGETRNLIYKMFNRQVGLRLHLENLENQKKYLLKVCEQQNQEKLDLDRKLREQKRSFHKNYDIQKRDHEQRIQLLLKSQTNSGVNGGAGVNNDVQAAFERKIQELKERLRKTSEEGQQYKRFFREHKICDVSRGGERTDGHDPYISKRISKRSRRRSSSRHRKSSDGSSKGQQTNSIDDGGTGSAGSDISALDPIRVERFREHARQMRMVENSVPNNSVTIKQKKHGKNRTLIIKPDDVD